MKHVKDKYAPAELSALAEQTGLIYKSYDYATEKVFHGIIKPSRT